MRNEQDIVQLFFSVSGSIELDVERIERDPVWETISRGRDLDDPAIRKQLLEQYLVRYLTAEQLLKTMPSTNGPADIYSANGEPRDPGLAKQRRSDG